MTIRARPSLASSALALLGALGGALGGGCGGSGEAGAGASPDGGSDAARGADARHPDARTPGKDSAGDSAEAGRGRDADGDAGSAAALLNAEADQAASAMLLGFWSQSAGYMNATAGVAKPTGYWTFAQAWDVVVEAAARHKGARFAGTLRTFHDAQAALGFSSSGQDGGDEYYDDDNWMTLALLRAYDATGDATYLTEAKSLYATIMGGWDTSCCGAVPGGIWWDARHQQKATASNAGPVISGALLYERTKDASYLTFAQQVYAYWSANMVDAATHQVVDHILPTGEKVAWKFTYNEGLMIGAAAALAHATGDTSTLTLAHPIASFMLASETEASPAGTILTDGPGAKCTGDCMQFKGIAATYLATLYAADTSHAEYLSLLDDSATAAWTIARDPSSGLFGVDWASAFAAPAALDATSSAAQALAAAAALAGPPPPDPAGTYEAEESVLHGVGLEASHAGFSGWGYVAGWNADGQWVDFLVTTPAAGSYDLALRYAAGAGDAARLVYINGKNVVDAQPFPSTGSWTGYATATATVTLPAGASTVSVIYSSKNASKGYLNLDRLMVTPHA